eukprot:SM000062S19945  [mRNA]  locus=s62:652738:654623:+ [translate_table: standard]
MGRPIFYDIIQRPATSALIAFCSAVWVYIQKHSIGYADVGINYEAVVTQCQYWRLLTAAFSHVSVVHLVLNMSALWSIGTAEALGNLGLGAKYYLKQTLVLLLLSGPLVIAMYHLLIHRFRLVTHLWLIMYLLSDHYRRVVAVGYSCVVFGWMTVLAVKQPSSRLDLFGLFSLPINLAPFESLVLTSIVVPQASFMGHLAGILVGYAVAWEILPALSDYWTVSLLLWLTLGFTVSLKQTSTLAMPFISIQTVQDPTLQALRPVSAATAHRAAVPLPTSQSSEGDNNV